MLSALTRAMKNSKLFVEKHGRMKITIILTLTGLQKVKIIFVFAMKATKHLKNLNQKQILFILCTYRYEVFH